MTDPFEVLGLPVEPQAPRPAFARALRARLADALAAIPVPDADAELPILELPARELPARAPDRRSPVPTDQHPAAATPYLAVHDAAAALAWYGRAFGATELLRMVGDDGRVGHAEVAVGDARVMLADEFPEIGVRSPRSLGGTTVTVHLEVDDVDARYASALAEGASGGRPPADQPHGNRTATLVDPFGHRWMLSTPVGDATANGAPARHRPGPDYRDGIWSVVAYRDVAAGIAFVVDVLGFEEQVLVTAPEDPSTIVHSEYRWPEGGVVQLAGWDDRNEFLTPPGTQSLYVVTADPWAVWARCEAAGVEVLRAPYAPHYDPDGMGFSVRDGEGNGWSVGSYAGGATG